MWEKIIQQLRAQITAKLTERAALVDQQRAVIDACRAAGREPTDDEMTQARSHDTAKRALDTEVAVLQARVDELVEEQRRDDAASRLRVELGQTSSDPAEQGSQRSQRGQGGAVVGAEPGTYRRGGRHSYFRDLAMVSMQRGDRGSLERLERNDSEVRADMQARALSTTDGAGGDFVPPLWLVDQFIELARPGRVTADRLRQLNLPAGTDSINLPRLVTGTAVAEQATQNTNLQNTDATTGSVAATVATLGGVQTVALQLIEQSPINVDEVLLADLAADYAAKVDVFVLTNNAAGKRGLLNVAGVNAVTYTSAAPTIAELYARLADALAQIHTGRLMPATVIVMHPRRWAWFLAATDTAGRPLVVPAAPGAMNALGSTAGVVAEGLVGTLQGLPVYVDPNIPTNLGAGANEDRILIFRADDVILYEGTPRAEAFRDTKAEQLSVLLRLYNYVALHSERYPKAISVVSGTGLVTPTF